MVRNTRREGLYAYVKFCKELGGNVACVMNGVPNTSKFKHHISENNEDYNEDMEEPKNPNLYLGDSWIGSVKVFVNKKS